jgi:uncharacterized protein (TIGR02246 family)
MKRFALALLIPFAFIPPVAADDFKQEVGKLLESYAGCYAKQDAACIAALYTKDGMWVSSDGKKDVQTHYAGLFKTGFNKLEGTVDETWQIDNDTPAAMGKFHITGKNDKGDALDAQGVWTAVFVKQGDGWKYKMLTAAVKPPPPPQAAAAK